MTAKEPGLSYNVFKGLLAMEFDPGLYQGFRREGVVAFFVPQGDIEDPYGDLIADVGQIVENVTLTIQPGFSEGTATASTQYQPGPTNELSTPCETTLMNSGLFSAWQLIIRARTTDLGSMQPVSVSYVSNLCSALTKYTVGNALERLKPGAPYEEVSDVLKESVRG
ncbi:uncharacterized protein N7518_003263 [Penicillium psychrosexuale]|uniref:uncharacterized protein n=1 Tax=Penicillium psychrosexuale TaxID=1002107 RepID=UPI00254517CD|nr:uncharacterized protein N7518_003263 [Penicillium psychrosexuale]KAJ5801195.1 hypothetical protein N7518_003263 [Penicillium psychrosexuale]